MVVDDKVRHFKQSFVTTKIRVSFKVIIQTQFARAPSPSSKREHSNVVVVQANFFRVLFCFRNKTRLGASV